MRKLERKCGWGDNVTASPIYYLRDKCIKERGGMTEKERATLLLTHGYAARRRRCCEELEAGSRFCCDQGRGGVGTDDNP